jgi:succinate dehydrogenase/fumarate reductase flavoprotein subunit
MKLMRPASVPSATPRRVLASVLALAVCVAGWLSWRRLGEVVVETDVLVVGAGLAGLSAAHEAGLRGAKVTVVEMNSVFGGNAVLSEGGVFIVDTPLQREQGYVDSAELAVRDMLGWGEDADPAWAESFVRASRSDIWDYLTSLGVRFTALRQQAGNHVRRFHENAERGLGLLRPIYRECLKYPNISFRWNTRVERLLKSDSGAVPGALGRDLRWHSPVRIHARSVILATGGFQGNERLVRRHWHAGWPQPDRLLLGASANSSGSGLLMATEAGAATHRLDHQWHYPFGVPDPRFPGQNRAVSVRNLNAIWINAQGRRFVNEWAASRYTVEAVVRQQPATYWLVFDALGLDDLRYSGTDWADPALARRLLVENSSVTRSGRTWSDLARAAGLPPETLEATVNRYNASVARGDDPDFHRFGPGALPEWLMVFTVPSPGAAALLRHPGLSHDTEEHGRPVDRSGLPRARRDRPAHPRPVRRR